MKPSELRIGNYVYENEKHIKQIKHIFNNTTYTQSAGKQFHTPIPLTEDWLLKFGFSLTLNNWYGGDGIHVNGRVIWLQKMNYNESYRVNLTETSISYVFYVHQLQNLYFALTGEELD